MNIKILFFNEATLFISVLVYYQTGVFLLEIPGYLIGANEHKIRHYIISRFVAYYIKYIYLHSKPIPFFEEFINLRARSRIDRRYGSTRLLDDMVRSYITVDADPLSIECLKILSEHEKYTMSDLEIYKRLKRGDKAIKIVCNEIRGAGGCTNPTRPLIVQSFSI